MNRGHLRVTSDEKLWSIYRPLTDSVFTHALLWDFCETRNSWIWSFSHAHSPNLLSQKVNLRTLMSVAVQCDQSQYFQDLGSSSISFVNPIDAWPFPFLRNKNIWLGCFTRNCLIRVVDLSRCLTHLFRLGSTSNWFPTSEHFMGHVYMLIADLGHKLYYEKKLFKKCELNDLVGSGRKNTVFLCVGRHYLSLAWPDVYKYHFCLSSLIFHARIA